MIKDKYDHIRVGHLYPLGHIKNKTNLVAFMWRGIISNKYLYLINVIVNFILRFKITKK